MHILVSNMLWASQTSHEASLTNGMEKDKGAKRAVAEDVVTIPGVDMGPYFIAILCHTLPIRIPQLRFRLTCCIQGVHTLVTMVARSSKATESP
jgi:hypothetical protein